MRKFLIFFQYPKKFSTCSKPKFIYVNNTPLEYKPVVDVEGPDFKFNKTIYKVFQKNYRNRNTPVKATADVLVEKYFPASFIQRIVNHFNAYVEECRRRMPSILANMMR